MLVSLGPWPLGVDNVNSQYSRFFQIPSEGENPSRLAAATDVDLDAEGLPATRREFEQVLVAPGMSGLWSIAGMLLAQDGSVLGQVTLGATPAFVPLVTGLTGNVALAELGGVVYWSDGVVCGAITNGVNSNWGMAVPPSPTLSTTAGTTPAGRYQVSITLEDAAGRESGVSKASLAVLTDGTKDITATLSSIDSSAVYANVYASEVNQKELFWVKRVAVAALPTTITAAQLRTSIRPLRTQHLRGPIPCTSIFTYQSFLMLCRDEVVFRSNGLSPHLFNVREDVFPHPSNVTGGVGVKDGFWTTTSEGLWWWSGEPGTWRNVLKDRRKYAAGVAQVYGGWFPKLQTEELVGIFISEVGPVATLPGGQLVPLTQGRYHSNVEGKRAKIAIYENTIATGAKVRQLAFTLI